MKTCRRCNASKSLSEFNKASNRPDGLQPYCRPCQSEIDRKHYADRRAMAIGLLGGQCVVCGTTVDLELDHIDPTTKTVDISLAPSLKVFLDELTKCQLLCGRHHKEKTIAEKSVEHGGGVSGKRNCQCDPCRARKSEYMRRYNQTK